MRYGKREYMGASAEIGVAKSLPVHMRAGLVELSNLFTTPQHRRQGYANTLMCMITAEADVAGKVLMLAVGDGLIGGASKQQLLSFYERHRFMPIQASPLLMARPPIGKGFQQPR